MAQEMCILPVQCERCGALFDLWYDLQGDEEGRTSLRKMPSQSFCWKCRQYANEKLAGEFEKNSSELVEESKLSLSFE
ncbi:hypothetical protein HY450_03975 [Candidatus Pacearchaeota archaeon]|nr:hypothetical protein [Candidatus Pacearchaeota archaeon]